MKTQTSTLILCLPTQMFSFSKPKTFYNFNLVLRHIEHTMYNELCIKHIIYTRSYTQSQDKSLNEGNKHQYKHNFDTENREPFSFLTSIKYSYRDARLVKSKMGNKTRTIVVLNRLIRQTFVQRVISCQQLRSRCFGAMGKTLIRLYVYRKYSLQLNTLWIIVLESKCITILTAKLQVQENIYLYERYIPIRTTCENQPKFPTPPLLSVACIDVIDVDHKL